MPLNIACFNAYDKPQIGQHLRLHSSYCLDILNQRGKNLSRPLF